MIAVPDAQVRIPLAMLNRHGLVAGATGTGKTKTLQVLAEQVSANGVPVFAADIKGDLSGIATPGASNDKLLERTQSIGQDWVPTATPTEYFTLGGIGTGVPIRATIEAFGPTLLSKVLGLNATQESSLGLVFHYARNSGLPLIDLDRPARRAHVPQRRRGQGRAQEARRPVGGDGRRDPARAHRLRRPGRRRQFFGQPEIVVSDFLRTDRRRPRHRVAARGARRAGQAGAVLDVPDVPAAAAVQGAARGRRLRQAQAGVLLRRGAPAVRGRVRRTSSRPSRRPCA